TSSRSSARRRGARDARRRSHRSTAPRPTTRSGSVSRRVATSNSCCCARLEQGYTPAPRRGGTDLSHGSLGATHRAVVPNAAPRSVLVPIVAGSLLLVVPALARAHERDFTLSRDWHLPYAGENEIESRTFWQTKHNDWVQQFEYEYGVTDHIAL